MSKTTEASSLVLPTGHGYQCPLCGVPVNIVTVAQAPTGERGVVFDCCGNLVTLTCLRDAFGLDLSGLA